MLDVVVVVDVDVCCVFEVDSDHLDLHVRPHSFPTRRAPDLASGAGATEAPADAEVLLTGASVLPPSPVHVRAESLPGVDLRVRWIRRSRAGWRWLDGVDVPLAEEREEIGRASCRERVCQYV